MKIGYVVIITIVDYFIIQIFRQLYFIILTDCTNEIKDIISTANTDYSTDTLYTIKSNFSAPSNHLQYFRTDPCSGLKKSISRKAAKPDSNLLISENLLDSNMLNIKSDNYGDIFEDNNEKKNNPKENNNNYFNNERYN